jgi:hypothetical protein
LWGDRGDKQARHSLSQTSDRHPRRDRRHARSIRRERESLAIEPGTIGADVIDLAMLAERDDLESLRAGRRLCRGPLLEGFRFPTPRSTNGWRRSARAFISSRFRALQARGARSGRPATPCGRVPRSNARWRWIRCRKRSIAGCCGSISTAATTTRRSGTTAPAAKC